MNLKELAQRINYWAGTESEAERNKIKLQIMEEAKPPVLPLRGYTYVKNSEPFVHIYCPRCGKEWDVSTASKAYYNGYGKYIKHDCCRTDGKDLLDRYVVAANFARPNYTINFNEPWNDTAIALEVDIKQGYVIFSVLSKTYLFDPQTDDIKGCLAKGNYDFLKGRWIPNFDSYFVFDVKYGLRAFKNGKVSTDTSGATTSLRDRAVSMRVIGIDLNDFALIYGIDCEETSLKPYVEASLQILEERKAKTNKRKNPEKESIDRYNNTSHNDLSLDKVWEKRSGFAKPLFLCAETRGDTEIINYLCPTCGNIEMIEVSRDETYFTCPVCKTEARRGYAYSMANNGHVYESYHLVVFDEVDGIFVQREFIYTEKLRTNGCIEQSANETKRVFYAAKRSSSYIKSNAEWVKDKERGRYGTIQQIQSPEEIKSIFQKTDIRFSGLLKAWGIDGNKSVEQPGYTTYIRKWYRYPFIETLYAAGLIKFVEGIIHGNVDPRVAVNKKGKSPCEILGITKPIFKIARDRDLGYYDIQALKSIYDTDHSMTEEIWQEISDLPTDIFVYLNEAFGIKTRKSVEYLNACHDYQCIQKTEALTLWRDYLRMAKDLGYDLSDKTRRFPRSLKLEHDKAMFSYNAIRHEIESKRFNEQAQINKKYEYSNGDLFVKIPETPEEIIEEGTNQKHCVASYVSSVRDGNTVVAFIRQKDEPTKSYFTMEIRDGAIRQMRGYTNRPPRDATLLDFISKFAFAKGLAVKY